MFYYQANFLLESRVNHRSLLIRHNLYKQTFIFTVKILLSKLSLIEISIITIILALSFIVRMFMIFSL